MECFGRSRGRGIFRLLTRASGETGQASTVVFHGVNGDVAMDVSRTLARIDATLPQFSMDLGDGPSQRDRNMGFYVGLRSHVMDFPDWNQGVLHLWDIGIVDDLLSNNCRKRSKACCDLVGRIGPVKAEKMSFGGGGRDSWGLVNQVLHASDPLLHVGVREGLAVLICNGGKHALGASGVMAMRIAYGVDLRAIPPSSQSLEKARLVFTSERWMPDTARSAEITGSNDAHKVEDESFDLPAQHNHTQSVCVNPETSHARNMPSGNSQLGGAGSSTFSGNSAKMIFNESLSNPPSSAQALSSLYTS
ncbi:hypothetical protein NE237_012277 [Protea cynaroides]|uniref:Uncharacterized protein n=1 Tax=Protea cynaroides TaxID=273540 RepID=A0A9Q0H1I8_9MAGN|nr:hypothetical protein NE237_012277 [Protea cynaroides]